MATRNTIVYLGYIDDEINSKNQHLLDYTVSKVGGFPNWCSTGCQIPTCGKCKRKLLLVVQLYAPLEGSAFHRVLYIFACITPECWNKSDSWVCIRSQEIDSQSIKTERQNSEESIAQHTTSDQWFTTDDDWGYDGKDDEDNGNNYVHPTTDMFLQYLSMKNYNRKNWTKSEDIIRQNCTKDGDKNKHNYTNTEDNLNLVKKSLNDVTNSMETQLNLNEGDSNANEPVCGAVGMEENVPESMEATAIIEGPEGDMIAVDSPNQIASDIPSLFKEVKRIDTSSDISFVSFFITTGIEPPESTGLSEHESELLLRYTQMTGQEFREEDICGATYAKGDAVYEKVAAHHGDIFLHKFKKRILRSPQQIIRYCRDEVASPLWIHPLQVKNELPKTCSYCNDRLIFEAQVMPQLISQLRIGGIDRGTSVLEFGTVILYTCASSCWKDGIAMRQEHILVQAEEI